MRRATSGFAGRSETVSPARVSPVASRSATRPGAPAPWAPASEPGDWAEGRARAAQIRNARRGRAPALARADLREHSGSDRPCALRLAHGPPPDESRVR